MRVQVFEDPRPNKEPSILLALWLIEFHPHGEDAEVVVTAVVPAAAERTVLAEVADAEAAAVLVGSVRTRPLAVERGTLARALEVRQDEADDQRRRTEARQVMLGEGVARARFGHERLLLVDILGLRVH